MVTAVPQRLLRFVTQGSAGPAFRLLLQQLLTNLFFWTPYICPSPTHISPSFLSESTFLSSSCYSVKLSLPSSSVVFRPTLSPSPIPRPGLYWKPSLHNRDRETTSTDVKTILEHGGSCHSLLTADQAHRRQRLSWKDPSATERGAVVLNRQTNSFISF